MNSTTIILQCQNRHPADIEFLQDWNNQRFYYLNNKRLSIEDSLAVMNKSPSGFDHGYSGSGPAQLALAICLTLYQQPVALQHYQSFKEQFIAPLPEGAFTRTLDVAAPVSPMHHHPFRVGDIVKVDKRFNHQKLKGYIYDEYQGHDKQKGVSILLSNQQDLGGFSPEEQRDHITFVEHLSPVYPYQHTAQLQHDIQEGWFDFIFDGSVLL